MKISNICVTRHPKSKDHNAEEIFEEIMVGILFFNLCIKWGMWNSSRININLTISSTSWTDYEKQIEAKIFKAI